MHGAAMWASCIRAPKTRFLDESIMPTTTSTKFRATRCYRSWAMRRRRDAWQTDAETVELLVWYVHLVYTHHCMTYDISYHISIYLSTYLPTYLSIYLSIHPSTHIHTVNIIAGRFSVWWLVFFLHTVVSIWRYILGGIQLLAYYCLLLSDMGSWGW